MVQRGLDSLGPKQLAVLGVLWDLGQASVHEVRDRLDRRKPPAYTTVLSTLQKLERLGWVRHEARGRTYIYRATSSRSAARLGSLRALIARFFRGDPLLLMENLLDEEPLGPKDLERLRRMIDARRKGAGP